MDKDLSNRVKFRHMQCFLAVMQFGSVQGAADSLAITQPAVSKTIAELEEILGARLFDRGRHGAAPTPQGQLFAPHARACLAALRQGVDEIREEGRLAPVTLALGVLPTVAGPLLPAVLAQFRELCPQVSLRISTGPNPALLDALKAGETALAIGRLTDPHSMAGMSFEHLYREPLAVAVRAGHPLLAQRGVTPAALAAYPIVVPPPGTLIRQSADSILTAFGARTDHAFVETLSVSLGRALTRQNEAVWFVPASVIEHDLAEQTLAPLPIPLKGTDEPIGLICRSDEAPAPALLQLMDAIRAAGLRREQMRIGA